MTEYPFPQISRRYVLHSKYYVPSAASAHLDGSTAEQYTEVHSLFFCYVINIKPPPHAVHTTLIRSLVQPLTELIILLIQGVVSVGMTSDAP